MNTLFRTLIFTVLIGYFPTLQAATVNCSNLTDDGTALLCEGDGQPMPAGCFARLGTFIFASDIDSLLETTGIQGVIAAMVPFGEAFSVGQGAEQVSGKLEVEASQPVLFGSTPFGSAPVHLLVLNGPDVEASTEILLLKFPGSKIPSDSIFGAIGHLSLHVRDAEVVFGTSELHGLLAAPVAAASQYASWIHDQLGNDLPDLLALSADGDADGVSNLVEYALGGDVTDGGEDAVLDFDLSGTEPKLTFLRRSDTRLVHVIELCQDLAANVWQPYTGPASNDSAPGLPPGFTRRSVTFTTRDRYFARVRIEYP